MAGMRGKQTVRGMFQSMAVILVAAGVIYLFVPHDENADPIKPVDYGVELVTAQRAAPYPVLSPKGLPTDWRPTSVSYERRSGDAWHLGYLTPEREYVAVEQSTSAPVTYIDEVTHGARDTGAAREVAGRGWQRYEGPKYDALVLREKGVTTVVTGTADEKRLAEMATALRPGEAPTPAPAAPSPAAKAPGA
ncbi:DUF4245 domain-containing protein [Streptomyces lichenis]|uniref:DUF4245 domain-containing protein n=1 Tax=Streptomyces lichenis TaxID=2306967 RepID=A0ABT0IJW8_9ACTN|nr:DUF4245 domain-containing protein [Streptomyces lichenis]MCK8681607.1 DUF4245 domain-containing protein [Streptomyces lichenis]